ncbi:MAG: GHKL domain-containing protein [Bacteroidetes bacterium]|nr:GHKL domain-containing protein [Bacteroidota bacterium]
MKNTQTIKIVLHLVFWIGFIAILNSETLSLSWGPMAKSENTWFIPLVFGMVINATLFYSNTFLFIPKYLHKKRYKVFLGWAVISLFGLTSLEFFFDIWYLFGSKTLQSFHSISGQEQDYTDLEDLVIFFTSTFIFNLFFWAMAFLYRWPKDWMYNERQKQQLLHDKLLAELEFLKAQINPHFLFNGINSIYHLMGDDVKTAQKVLLRFSDLLRYQLYECNEDFISLKKELKYVQNYMSIEEVRKGQDAIISKDLKNLLPLESEWKNLNGLKIAPLLLTPFLENAFKYLSLFSNKKDNRLSIHIKVENSILHFQVENTIDPSAEERKNAKASGIGLENVKRRLELIYPDKYNLKITNTNGVFSVNLNIELGNGG